LLQARRADGGQAWRDLQRTWKLCKALPQKLQTLKIYMKHESVKNDEVFSKQIQKAEGASQTAQGREDIMVCDVALTLNPKP
jgi:hypothetical protein